MPRHPSSGPASSALVIERLNLPDTVPSEQVKYILESACTFVDLPPRADLFRQGDLVEYVYLLHSGRVHQARWDAAPNGAQQVSLRRTLEPNALIGLYDLLYRQPYSIRTRALEESRLIAIEADAINRLIYRFPTVRNHLAPLQRISRLRTIPFLADLDLMALSFVADACEEMHCEANGTIYERNAPAESLYLIDQGQVRLQWPDGDEIWLGNGMAFGYLDQERAGMRTPVTTHEAVAMASTRLIAINRRTLIDIAAVQPERIGAEQLKTCLSTIQNLKVFREFSDKQRNQLLGYMSFYYIAGQRHLLMQQGEVSDSMWVLLPDSNATVVALNEAGSEIARSRVQGPTYFNETALRVQSYLDSTVDAETGSQWLRLHRDDFQVFLQETDKSLAEKLVMTMNVADLLGAERARRRYEWLQEGERLILFRRRHWVALLRMIAWPLLASIGLLALWLLVSRAASLPPYWQFWIWGGLGAINLGFWLWGVVDYLNDYLLITNSRVVRQEKVEFITELRQSAALRQVQNVDVRTSFLGNLLNYGTVVIQTAGTEGAIRFDRVRDPSEIRAVVFDERGRTQMQYRASGKMAIQSILEERLGLTLEMPARTRAGAETPGEEGRRRGWGHYLRYLMTERYLNWREGDSIVWRKHWFVLMAKLSVPLLLLLVCILGAIFFLSPGALLNTAGVPVGLGLAGVIALIGLGVLAWCLWIYADWRNDSYRIEGDQVIDVEKKPLFFSEQRRTALLGDIENVQLSIPSPLHYLLNFGNVELQTAATYGDLTFASVPNPRAVVEEVRRRIDSYHAQQEMDRARRRAEELPDWFEMYNRLDAD